MSKIGARFEVDTGKCGQYLKAFWQPSYVPRASGVDSHPPAHGPGFWAFESHTTTTNLAAGTLGILGPSLRFNATTGGTSTSHPRMDMADSKFSLMPSKDGGASIFAWGIWVNHDVLDTNNQRLIGQFDSGGGASSVWRLELVGNATPANIRYAFHRTDSTDTTASVTAGAFGAPSASEWNLVVGYCDPGATTIGISVNGSAYDTTGGVGGTTKQNTISLTLGARNDDDAEPFDGEVGGVFFWRGGFPPVNELKALYNSGRGSRLVSGLVV